MELLNKAYEALKEQIRKGNELGIPVPLVRDPKTGKGSVSLTLTFLSFNLCFFGTIAKITNIIGEVDMTNALWLFGICTSLYFGRKFQRSAGGEVIIEAEVKDENKG